MDTALFFCPERCLSMFQNNYTKSYKNNIPINLPIEVVVNFNKAGDMQPEYIRLTNPDCSIDTYRIDKVMSKNSKHGVEIFDCQFKTEERMERIRIYYDIKKHLFYI